MIDNTLDVGQTLPTVRAQGGQRHLARIDIKAGTTRPRGAILLTMNTKVMQMQSLQAEPSGGVVGRVARDILLRMRIQRQISGLIPCTTTQN